MKPTRETNPPIEWLGACLTIPTHLFDPTKQAEPLGSLVWMIPDGPVLGSLTLEPDQSASDMIVDHFEQTTQSPLVGNPHRPTRLRIADEELAATLRKALSPAIEVVCAPTPEFHALLEGMTEFVQQTRPAAPSYLSAETSEESVAAFFRAAAALFLAQPWTIMPADVPILLDVEALSLKGAALVVIGHGNREFGFLLFASEADFNGFLRAAKLARPSAPPPLPLFALDYNRGADIPLELRKEVTSHGWQVANANAYPAITVLDERFREQPPTPVQLHQAEAIALAVAEFARTRLAARAADQPSPTSIVSTVATHAGPIDAKLSLATAPARGTHEGQPSATSPRPRAKWKKKRK